MTVTNPLVSSLPAGSVIDLQTTPGGALRVAIGPTTQDAVTITTPPADNALMLVGQPYLVQGTAAGFNTPRISVQLGTTNQPVVATLGPGNTWSAVITPLVADAGANTITATAVEGSSSAASVRAVDIENGTIAWWLDFSNANSYTLANASKIAALKSLVTGTPDTTVVGTPQIATDPRNAQPGYYQDGASWVLGTDATALAAVNGLDKPFTAWFVFTPDDTQGTVNLLGFGDSTNSGNGWEFVLSAGRYFFEKLGNPSGPARDWNLGIAIAGTHVIRIRSLDGLTVFLQFDGGAEVSVTLTSPGAIATTQVGAGIMPVNPNKFPFAGFQHVQILSGQAINAAARDRITAGLLAQWKRPPQVYFVGDSITTGEIPNDGGFRGQMARWAIQQGLLVSQQGPFSNGGPYPLRHSAQSGNTAVNMKSRIDTTSTGLGASAPFQQAVLLPLFCGTNPTGPASQSASDYQLLLMDGAAKSYATQPSARWMVTPITPINGADAYVNAYNALLPAIWDAHDVAFPANPLIRWNAFQAFGGSWDYGNSQGWYFDSTHPSSAGYAQLWSAPGYGMQAACEAFLRSVQP